MLEMEVSSIVQDLYFGLIVKLILPVSIGNLSRSNIDTSVFLFRTSRSLGVVTSFGKCEDLRRYADFGF